MGHVASYYAATANPAPRRPALAGEMVADVCVVGGGIAGCAAALELAERGQRVVLLEAQRIGWGASGRNGGFVLSWWPKLATLARVMGTSVAMIDRTYGHLARDSEQAIRARLDARGGRSGVLVASPSD